MKQKMFSSKAIEHLFFHILDGFKTSHEGIIRLQEQELVSDKEISDLILKNAERLIIRVQEFRITENILDMPLKRTNTWNIVKQTSEHRRSRGLRKRRTIKVIKR